MALTKDQLRTENQNSFPDNTDGLITPQILRDYNDDVIDSLVVSADTGSLVTTTTFNDFSQSTDSRLDNIETTTSSLQTQIDNIDTGSLLETASVNLNTITFTKADASTFDITVDTGSGGGGSTDITALNEFTSSQLTINSGYNTFTESADSRLDNIETATGSFARTDVANNFTGSNNTFPMQFDLRPTNSPPNDDSRFRFDSFQNRMQISLVSDDTFFDREIRFYPSASYSGGFPQDSELGFSITEGGVFSFGNKIGLTNSAGDDLGSFIISGSTEGDSYVVKLSDTKIMEYNYDSDFIIHNNINARGGIDAQGASTFFGGITVQSSFAAPLTQGNVYVGDATGTTSEIATGSLSVAFAQDAEDLIIGVKNTSAVTLPKGTPVYATGVTGENINIESASNASSATMPAIGLLNEELTPNSSGQAVLNGRIIGVNTDGFTAGQPVYVNSDGDFTQTKPTGTALIQNVGVVGKVDASDGEIIVVGAGRSNDIPNITEGYAWVGNGDGVATATSTASWDEQTDITSLNAFTASQETKNTTLETVTSSFDSRLDNIELATGSYATTGSNTFTANQIISGTLDIEQTFTASLGEGLVFVGDANGRTVTVETSSFGGGGGGFPFEGDAQISGSLGVTGSMSGFVNALSITSNTASVDFNDGNMFTLTLASSADTHIDPTNIKAGQTINIQITQPATSGSISFAPTVLFAGNAPFEATQTGSAVDMVTLVSFDGTNVLATGIKNFE